MLFVSCINVMFLSATVFKIKKSWMEILTAQLADYRY